MKPNKEDIRSWKSYLMIWGALIIIAMAQIWQHSFILDEQIISVICTLFLIFNGTISLLYIFTSLVLEKTAFRKFIKSLIWIPFIIDFLLLLLTAIILFKTNTKSFKFSVAILVVTPIIVLISIKIRLLFPPYKKWKK